MQALNAPLPRVGGVSDSKMTTSRLVQLLKAVASMAVTLYVPSLLLTVAGMVTNVVLGSQPVTFASVPLVQTKERAPWVICANS